MYDLLYVLTLPLLRKPIVGLKKRKGGSADPMGPELSSFAARYRAAGSRAPQTQLTIELLVRFQFIVFSNT